MRKISKLNFNFQYVFFLLFGIQTCLINTPLELQGVISTTYFAVELVLFFVCLAQEKISLKKLLIITILLGYGTFTYIYLKETVMIVMLMAAIVASFMPWNPLLKYIYRIRLIGLITIIFLSLIGLLNRYSVFVSKGIKGEVVHGYGLGFTHPNKLAFAVGTLVCIWILYKNNKLSMVHRVSMLILVIITYEITQSRSILFIGLLLIVYLSVNNTKIIGFLNKIGMFVMPLSAVFSLVIPYIFSRASGQLLIVINNLNNLFSGRFTHSANIFSSIPIPAFGGIFNLKDYESLYSYTSIDNGYQAFLYEFGLVGLLLFLTMYFLAAKKLLKLGKTNSIIAIACFALWGISENILRSPAFILTPIFWSVLMQDENK